MKKIIKFLKRLFKIPDKNVQFGIEVEEYSNLFNQPHHYSNEQKLLSAQEIRLLIERADMFRSEKKYAEALFNYNLSINNPNPLPSYFRGRAFVYDGLAEFSKSIDDIKTAIQMDPDNADYYWELGGYLVSNEMVIHGKITGETSKKVLKAAADSYMISLRKDPVNQCAWINLIEIHLFLKNWYEAICHFGSSKPYVNSISFQLIRSFLGSLALTFCDEEFDNADQKILQDLSIRISNDNYRVCEIESLISELETSEVDISKINKTKEIYRLFLAHYDDEPRRYGSGENGNHTHFH